MISLPLPAAVVFDLDGVLVDSEEAWQQAEAATVERFGGVYDEELRHALHGRGHRDGARIVAERVGGGDEAEIAEVALAEALLRIGPGVDPMPGAAELVASLVGRCPLAVCSNSVRAIVDVALHGAGLEGFDAVVAGEDARRAKPEPDPYLEACRRLGVAPGDAVAIEDSPTGVASARAAGLTVVGVPARGVGLPGADVVVRSLSELRFD